MKKRLMAYLATFLLPFAAIIAIPAPAHAATYCYTVIAFDPSGWIYGAGLVDQCIQPIQAEIHLREDRPLQPDREVNFVILPGVTAAFMETGAHCNWDGQYRNYFIETRVKVNGSYQQKVQSHRWRIPYYCF